MVLTSSSLSLLMLLLTTACRWFSEGDDIVLIECLETKKIMPHERPLSSIRACSSSWWHRNERVSQDSDDGSATHSLAGGESEVEGYLIGLPPNSLSLVSPTTILADSLVPPRLLANTVVCWG
jgi:hypothetical protein